MFQYCLGNYHKSWRYIVAFSSKISSTSYHNMWLIKIPHIAKVTTMIRVSFRGFFGDIFFQHDYPCKLLQVLPQSTVWFLLQVHTFKDKICWYKCMVVKVIKIPLKIVVRWSHFSINPSSKLLMYMPSKPPYTLFFQCHIVLLSWLPFILLCFHKILDQIPLSRELSW